MVRTNCVVRKSTGSRLRFVHQLALLFFRQVLCIRVSILVAIPCVLPFIEPKARIVLEPCHEHVRARDRIEDGLDEDKSYSGIKMMAGPTGVWEPIENWITRKNFATRSRLYRRRSQRSNTHWKMLAAIHKIHPAEQITHL